MRSHGPTRPNGHPGSSACRNPQRACLRSLCEHTIVHSFRIHVGSSSREIRRSATMTVR